jgi:hypothetical protein
MPAIASYRHRLRPTEPEAPGTEPGVEAFVAVGLNDSQETLSENEHEHAWRRRPPEQQPLAGENRFVWYCTGCNALQTLEYWQKP